MKTWKHKLLGISALAILASPALAQTQDTPPQNTPAYENMSNYQDRAQGTAAYEDESPIVLSGTIKSVNQDDFIMNYGGGDITVNMEDWDWFGDESNVLTPGDQIVVSGNIDDDLFTARKINPDSIYLVSGSRYYYRDQANAPTLYIYSFELPQQGAGQQAGTAGGATPQGGAQGSELSWVSAVGTVRNITGQQITLDAGNYDLTVDVGQLGEQAQNINTGEKVYVAGLLNQDFFQNRELSADRLITLSEEKGASQTGLQGDQDRMRQQTQSRSRSRIDQPGSGQNTAQ